MASHEGQKPLVLYKPPTAWSLIRSTTINIVLPFINGLMLGFGELFAHEAAFRLGWGGARVFPSSRRNTHLISPDIEIRDEPRVQPGGLDDLISVER
ncbi:outer membrane protein TOM13-domain-containing protein [Xylaria sp. CBS 124048]|nr:outer membrane protein TOM13-domain-containing protein [Xylaria sp. CBS 124048]